MEPHRSPTVSLTYRSAALAPAAAAAAVVAALMAAAAGIAEAAKCNLRTLECMCTRHPRHAAQAVVTSSTTLGWFRLNIIG
jgi:hypothetical protein